MANVTSVSFTCPHCAKVLRASAKPAAGKRIKCPACSHPFVPELDGAEDETTRIQEKPRTKVKSAPSRAEDEDDEKPRNKKSRADEDDDEPRSKRNRDDEDEDDEDEDDRPIKKKKAKKSKGMLLLLLGGGFLALGGLFSCALCGVGAFVWPGFLLSNPNNELLAFVAPDANVLVGGRPKELKAKFAGFKEMFAQGGPIGAANDWPEMEDLVLNSDQFLVSMNSNNNGKNAVAVVKATTGDIEKLKKSNRLEAGKTIGGHTLHKLKNAPAGNFGGAPEYVAFTGDRFVVVADLDENNLLAALDRGKKGPAKSTAIDLCRSVEKSPGWVAFAFDAKTRQMMRQGFDQGGQQVPGLRAAAPAIDGAKGATFAIDVTGNNDVKLTASIMCKDAGDAGKLKAGLEDGWKIAKGFLDAAALLGGPAPGPQAEAGKLMMRDLSNLSFKTQGDTASATLTFTNQTIQELARAGKNMPFDGFGFNPPRPKFDGNPKIDGNPKLDGIAKIDGNPKVDGKPKFDGRPKFDGGPKIGKGKQIANFIQNNIAAGQKRENIVQLTQGKRVTVTMVSITQGFADVDLHVYRGVAGGDLVAGDGSIGPNGNVNFLVPVTGPYRIEVTNLGQGISNVTTVNVFEQ